MNTGLVWYSDVHCRVHYSFTLVLCLLKICFAFRQIGENIVLRRGVTFTCKKEGYQLIGLTHPSGNATSVNYGRYGTVMAYTKDPNSGELPEGETTGNK